MSLRVEEYLVNSHAAGANVVVAMVKNPAKMAAARNGEQCLWIMALKPAPIPNEGLEMPLTTLRGTPAL